MQTVLVAGGHRIAAYHLLGLSEIEARFIPRGRLNRNLAMLSENLDRSDLTVLECAAHTMEYVHVLKSKDKAVAGSKKSGKKGRPRGGDAKLARDIPIQGRTADARRKTLARHRKIAGITEAAKKAAVDAGLSDNLSALLEIANALDEKSQLVLVAKLAKGTKAVGNSKSKEEATATAAPIEKSKLKSATYKPKRAERQFARLRARWNKACTEARDRFVQEVLKSYKMDAGNW